MTPKNCWQEVLAFPLAGRQAKPRTTGLTMVLDKGLGLIEARDLFDLAGDYIDFVKLGFGTSALYDEKVLRAKIRLARDRGIDIYPGGTFLEVAVLQGKLHTFLLTARSLGFTAVEVSEGTIAVDDEMRRHAIATAADLGFKVLTEVGKKNNPHPVEPATLARKVKSDLAAGAHRVIIEGRDCGRAAGFYDGRGQIRRRLLQEFLALIENPADLIWEAPLKEQQQHLILLLGPNVNLGNVPPGEVLALEALRVGLRSDTLQAVCGPRVPAAAGDGQALGGAGRGG